LALGSATDSAAAGVPANDEGTAMQGIQYDRRRANELLPLLGAIGREIQERTNELERLENRIELFSSLPSSDAEEIRRLVAEAATHRRELRRARLELERLGCSVVGTAPLTFRIPVREGRERTSFVWQSQDTVLK
jgi:hypothetical protein